MKNFVIGVIVTLLVLAAAGYAYFWLGFAPVAAAAPPMPFELTLARMGLHAQLKKVSALQSPIQPDEANLLAGAHTYVEYCAFCHGSSGQPEGPVAKGMFPHPPQLFNGDTVTDDPVGSTYWKVANGIRLSGMPGFKGALSDTQLWQVALLLKNADKLTPSVKSVVSQTAPK
jgi:mono/diheme cytochrome c family protein